MRFILVDAKIYDEFIPLLIDAVNSMKVGNPAQDDTDIGSVISPDHMKKVLSYIEYAKQEGGRIISGGERMILPQPNSNGSFIAPTIIEGLVIPDVRQKKFLACCNNPPNSLQRRQFEWLMALSMDWQDLFGLQT